MEKEKRFAIAMLFTGLWLGAAPQLNRPVTPTSVPATTIAEASRNAPAPGVATGAMAPCYIVVAPQQEKVDIPLHNVYVSVFAGLLILFLGLTGLTFVIEKLQVLLEKAVSLVGVWKRLVNAWRDTGSTTGTPSQPTVPTAVATSAASTTAPPSTSTTAPGASTAFTSSAGESGSTAAPPSNPTTHPPIGVSITPLSTATNGNHSPLSDGTNGNSQRTTPESGVQA